MASTRKDVLRAVKNVGGGEMTATHGHIMAKLNLTGCTRRQFDEALKTLRTRREIRVTRTETHITIRAL